MADLPDYYTQAQISEAEAASFKGGLEANRSLTPVSRDIYLATDTIKLFYCVVDGAWIDVTHACLLLAGGAMTGDIAMGGNKVTGLGAPAAAGDAARKAETDLLTLLATFNNHKARHQNGGADELSVAGLSGLLADDQHVLDAEVLLVAAALVHAARHQNGGADEISIAGLLGESAELATHKAVKAAAAILGHVIVEAGSDIDVDALGKLTLGGHKTRHQNGGDDEISVAGLSGLLADDQHVLDAEVLLVAAALVHAARHQNGGADEISVAGLSGLLADDQHVLDAEVLAVAAAKAHESTHVAGGSDDIDSALAIAAMAGLTTGKIWKGVGNRPSEVDIPVPKKIATGSYTGNDTDDRQITVGFKCSLVIVFPAPPNKSGRITSAGFSRSAIDGADQTDCLLHATDGFVVDQDAMNQSAYSPYSYWAISE